MNTNIDTFSVTDLRHRTAAVLKKALEDGLVYLVHRSKPKAAVVDLEYLSALQEAYEDYLDILEFDRTIRLPRISLADHTKHRAKSS